VGLGTPAVVRLVGALAHDQTPSSYYVQGASKLQDATLAERGGATARPYARAESWSTTSRVGTPTNEINRQHTLVFPRSRRVFSCRRALVGRYDSCRQDDDAVSVPVCWSSALFAYHDESAKTRQAGGSFASVSLFHRATSGSRTSSGHPGRPPGRLATARAQVVDNLWTGGGAERLQHVKCGAGSGNRRRPRAASRRRSSRTRSTGGRWRWGWRGGGRPGRPERCVESDA
jgi:hypothetical protein